MHPLLPRKVSNLTIQYIEEFSRSTDMNRRINRKNQEKELSKHVHRKDNRLKYRIMNRYLNCR